MTEIYSDFDNLVDVFGHLLAPTSMLGILKLAVFIAFMIIFLHVLIRFYGYLERNKIK